MLIPSLPSRERGLKSAIDPQKEYEIFVAPLAGAWIEICQQIAIRGKDVASLPSRERGLKSF